MKREAFKMFLKPGFEKEYEKRHAAIWPELKKMLSDGGVYDYSIYWDKDTNILFACQKTKGDESSQDMGANPIVQKWWDYMADIMEVNPELNVDQLVSYFSLSRTNFFHKLKSLTGMAPIMYIKEIRMRKAAELIKENQYTMAEIAYMVGFSDPHYFSKSFKSYWGMTSTEYAKNQIGR